VDYVAIQDSQIQIKDIYLNDSWHLNILYTPLSSEMKERITSTGFILNNGTVDCFIWRGNIDGTYTASSGYKWLLQQKHYVPSIQSWNWIWKLQGPEKIKFLIWCACHHSIPTMYMLHHRNMTSSSICPRCLNNAETVIHCLRDCVFAQRIWEALGYSNISFFNFNNLESWIKINSNAPNANLFLAGLWWNWRARNIVCVGNESIHMYQVLIEVRKLASLILSCFPNLLSAPKPPSWVTWHPSRDVGFVLNVDGSCLGDSGRAGFGGLVREGDGSWIIGFSGFLGISNITFAELMAIFHGLKIARERGYKRIHCYSDSQTVVDVISKDLNSFHCYAAVIASIKDLLQMESILQADALRVHHPRA
jgi:ribonuclease HI